MLKHFAQWLGLKEKTHNKSGFPNINEGEIWWCLLGANIGDEEDGKGELFSRPILVIKKFNKHLFWGIPLSTQLKENEFYYKFSFHKREQSAMLSQLKAFDTKRLTTKMGQLDNVQFKAIRDKIKSLL